MEIKKNLPTLSSVEENKKIELATKYRKITKP
jgi:hypothetical protein